MVYVYIGLTFMLLLQLELGYTATCGSLEFEQDTVTEGGAAKLIYKTLNINAPRKWYRWNTDWTLLYEDGKSNSNTKYAEEAQGETFILSMKGVVQADSGTYTVYCGKHHSDETMLTVTPSPTGARLIMDWFTGAFLFDS
ncbi:uncharacterized protein LOC128546398 [Mercenaria mercenaria]|uniref:uncharacterized protein LOC128546398 n=1 Tax=Mercenaria mercenaria TaxID=6596 RepID=UPI00234EFD25|nr:uncharacterized protein LOC128546398 [Mercenaria mercenaria]